MGLRSDIDKLVSDKIDLKKQMQKIEAEIKEIDKQIIDTASAGLGIKVGDIIDNKYTKNMMINKFDRVVQNDIVDGYVLKAQCNKLNKDGTIDKRVDPRYNIVSIGHI